LPLVGSPVRAAADAARAGVEAVAAGRLVVGASATFPLSGGAGLESRDLSGVHEAAVGAMAAVDRAAPHLGAAERALAGPSGASLPIVSGPARAMQREIASSRRQLDAAHRGLGLLAGLTDTQTDARLLVLAQDTLELRPTGGFIGSFGILHFAHGAVTLEGYRASEDLPPPSPPLPAPDELVPNLSGFWGLSNANWYPDFPTTASTATELFRRQGGGNVDGVIALTELATARLVGAVGPVPVPGYAKPVVEEGFEQRVVYEVETKRPRDEPRKRFLTELAATLFDRIFHLPADQVGRVGHAIERSVGAGDVQLWFADPARQHQLDGTVVSGSLPATGRDFLMLVDANMTASKANLGVVKTASYGVRRTGGGRLQGHLEITVRDDGDANGINPYYNGFLRAYVPKGSHLLGANATQSEEGPAPDGPYDVFSQLIAVEPHGQQTAVFDYLLPASVAPHGNYELTWQRQVGTPHDVLGLSIDRRALAVPPDGRVLRASTSVGDRGLVAFLRRRWIVRRLGLSG
jgi:hypothetical protein